MTIHIFAIDNSTNTAQNFRMTDLGLLVPASALNARTGVTVTPVLTGTGNWTCTISPFSCIIDGTSNSLQASYRATLDAATTVTVNVSNTQARIDLIGLQIQDNTYDGSGQHQGIPVYVAGTPGLGTAPTTPANTIPLFTVPVAANATSANFAGATPVFPFTAAAGGIVPVRSAADKPAAAGGAQYRHRLDVTATATGPSPLESSVDGATWTPVSNPDGSYGTWTNLPLVSGLTPYVSNAPQWRTAPGGRIEFRGGMSTTSTWTPGLAFWNSGGPTPSSNRSAPLCAVNGLAVGLDIAHSGSGSLSAQSAAGPYASGTTFLLDGCSCST